LKKYKCKETFHLDKYDDNGFVMDKQMAVIKGSVWKEDTESQYNFTGNDNAIRLNRIAKKIHQWIEVEQGTIDEYFEPVNYYLDEEVFIMYKMIFDDGEIKILVATDLSYEECVALKAKQEKPECYHILEV